MKIKNVINEAKFKKFNQIKKGDKGEDYGYGKGEVIAKAIGKKGFKKLVRYDRSGAMEDYFTDPFTTDEIDVDKVPLVAVKLEDGSTAVYVYGDGGFDVYV